MAGDAAAPQRAKEMSAPSIQCPMLSATNYTVWAIRMKLTLRVSEVWDTIDPGVADPKKNDVATTLLFQSIPESLILQIGELDTAKKVWEAIKTRHQGADRVKAARLQTLVAELDRLTMSESDKVDEFAGKISGLASQSASLGETIDETKLVKKFLTGLPRSKYIHIVASLEQVLDLTTTSFEDIVGRIKAYEERIRGDIRSEDQEKLMYANSNNSRGGHGGYRGRGNRGGSRGRGSNNGGRGRGRGRTSSQNQSENAEQKPKKDLSKIICWRCDKPGHYATLCPEKANNHETNLNETQEDEALYVHEVVFLNEDKVFPQNYETNTQSEWYLDNGASNHMTGNVDFFSSLDKNIRGKVKFGDGSYVSIVGKGSIVFIGKTGEKRTLNDIYYIPELKHNIISLGQATEGGCEVNMKGNALTLKDSSGRLLVRVIRSANRLYKTPMEISYPKCLLTQGDETTKTWHARLGHVSIGVMNNMIKKEMVIGMPQHVHENDVCDVCMAGKQTRKAFPVKSSYRATQALELVHGDLCGPISPSTPASNRYVFVLIDDFSRYMWSILLKEKSEAFDRFKRFKELVEKQTGLSIKTFRTDRGGEFTSSDFNRFCEERGVLRHLTAPYTPQQNGVVERRNRTLMEMTRSLLKGMKVPNEMWGEAVHHATYLINRIPTKALNGQTPYESFTTNKPNIAHLRVFGCVAYAKITTPHLKKLDDRSKTVINLGTEEGSKAYRLYDPIARRVIVSRDVVFDESKAWEWERSTHQNTREPGMFILPRRGHEEDDTGHVAEVNDHDHGQEEENHDEEDEEDEVVSDVEENQEEVIQHGANQHESKVYRLYKALYGLRQAPRAWNVKLDHVLKEMSFKKCVKEPSVYLKEERKESLIVAIYVDDLFVTGSSKTIIEQFKKDMSRRFEMSDLGKLSYYLGIEVIQGAEGIKIKQEGYAQGILVDTKMDTCNLTHVPMESNLKISKAEDEPEIDATQYRRAIGCLRYLIHTRPDLSYAVGVLSRYMHSPRVSHGQAIKHVLRYVKGTTEMGLFFKRDGSRRLVGYSDSSHNIDVDDGRSTSGHIFYFGSSPITWTSMKQQTVAMSSCEAEFMAATEAAKQAVWLKELLSEILRVEDEKVLLRVDNKSAIALTKNPMFHGRSKHILRHYHFVRECVENMQIEVEYVPGEEQKADILTKALTKNKFKEMRSLIGVQAIPGVHVGIKGENVGIIPIA